jgi:hypothetical protein
MEGADFGMEGAGAGEQGGFRGDFRIGPTGLGGLPEEFKESALD